MRQSPLSFVRSLMNRAIRDRWQITLESIDIDANGDGNAVYRIAIPPSHVFHLIVFSGRAPEAPTDRAWEVNWDILVWLIEGEPDPARIASAAAENAAIVRGYGRPGMDTLSWTRANRSGRLLAHTVDRLAEGRQPDIELVAATGYLIRNIYYQANGMLGTRMFGAYAADHPLRGAYQVQMLGIIMMREFSFDLVEQMARARSPAAAALDPAIKTYLGVGNATGIGLNLVFSNHPRLMSRWLEQRETALATALQAPIDPAGNRRMLGLLHRYLQYSTEDRTPEDGLIAGKTETRHGIALARDQLARGADRTNDSITWQGIVAPLQSRMNIEAQEIVNALLLESHPEICDEVDPHTSASEALELFPEMTIGRLLDLAAANFRWALDLDLEDSAQNHWIWYRSVEGEEPRLAAASEGLVPSYRNLVRNIPRLIQRMIADAKARNHSDIVARLLLEHPEHRDIVRIVQAEPGMRYGTLRTNMLHKDFSPLHLTRFVLQALKGMDKSSSMSDRWARGVFLQGAPTRDQITAGTAGTDWIYPPLPRG
jgi:hypothetical protein